MRTKDCISRCLHIIRRLKRGQKASFTEIQRYLNEMSALTGEDYTISIRTFQRDVDTIRELFLIDIRYSRTEGLYAINDVFSDEVLSERLIESLEVFHSLKMMDNLSSIFHFEVRPPLGTEHLSRMIFAIKNKRIITLTYNKNWENQFTERTLLPLLLKEFRGRWYVVAKRMDADAVRIYSLDRVFGFIIHEQQATPPANLGNYFYYSFGIYVNTDPNPQEVVLKFSPDAGRYVKDAVLHHSQQVIEDSAEAFVVKLYLSITFDFVMEILGYGELVEVISPPELRAQVSDRLKKAEEKYK
jgi:proteasome accessory factor B